jgi:hypothetical protein
MFNSSALWFTAEIWRCFAGTSDYMLRDGLDPQKEHTLKVRIANERNELSVGNNCRIVYFGINGDPRKPKNTICQ